jgi:IS605 OrfB family transposase
MKTTIKAILININGEQQQIIDNMMIVFSSAVRFSFNRLLEGMEIKELEKYTSYKYCLNIRQSKDAVENARQIIASQRRLVKINYDNYTSKVKYIENILETKNIKLTDKKKSALNSKLDKRKRKQEYLKKHIDNCTIPPVIFGTKEMFLKRCKGQITNEEWKACRNNRIYSRGDKTKKGNPNLRVVILKGMSFLEISILDKTKTNRAVKIQIPLYIPQKLSKKTGKVNGINYREMFLNYLESGEAYQVEMVRKNDKYYVHITFEEQALKSENIDFKERIGIDTNPDGFALTLIDSTGNYKWDCYLYEHQLLYARSNKRANLCGQLVKRVIAIAKEKGCSIAVEDLNFKDDKDVTGKFARIKHQFVYRTLLTMLERACIRNRIEVIKVRPQFTSKIGLYKYCPEYRLDIHNGAAMVIARRSYGFKERVPIILKDRLIEDKENFNKQREWGKWNIINRIIEMKGGKNPGLWLLSRKTILGLDKVS